MLRLHFAADPSLREVLPGAYVNIDTSQERLFSSGVAYACKFESEHSAEARYFQEQGFELDATYFYALPAPYGAEPFDEGLLKSGLPGSLIATLDAPSASVSETVAVDIRACFYPDKAGYVDAVRNYS